MIRKVLCITSLLALALTACSSDDGGGGDGGDTSSGVLTVEVLLTDAGCEPADITTPLGPDDVPRDQHGRRRGDRVRGPRRRPDPG